MLQKTTVHAFIQIFISLYWVYLYAKLWYLYRFSSMIFVFMYPTRELSLFILMGLIGGYLGLLVYLKKREIRSTYLLLFYLFLLGVLIDVVVVSF